MMQTSQRPIIITPLVGLTECEWRIVAEAVRDAANKAADRLMAERQRTPQEAPSEPIPTFGGRVRVTAEYRRYAYGERRREWHAVTVNERDGIYIGKRSLANGEIQWDDDPGGAGFHADKERIAAALVVYSERRNPVLVPFDAVEVVQDA